MKKKSKIREKEGRIASEQPPRTHKQAQKMADIKGFADGADAWTIIPVDLRRSRRRHHLSRMKAKAQWIAKNIWLYPRETIPLAIKYANHTKPCSCWMCGNQRYWHGPTMQEKRYASNEREAKKSRWRGPRCQARRKEAEAWIGKCSDGEVNEREATL